MSSNTQDNLCGRCMEEPAIVKTRKELFCKECFSKFILLKQRRTLISDKDKFLEPIMKVTYKTPNDDKLLLALSFGKSSLIVLQNLIEYLNNQYNQQKKTGFILETITVVEDDEEHKKVEQILKRLQQLPEFKILNKDCIKFKIININTYINASKSLKNFSLNALTSKLSIKAIGEDEKDTTIQSILLDSFGTQFKTLSSKEDFKTLAVNNAIYQIYEKFGYKGLIYGSSMSKLATNIVKNVVIGRGEVIAKDLDNIFYPLTDVFYSEVEAYYDLIIQKKDILLNPNEISNSNNIFINETKVINTKVNKQTKTISDITMEYFNTIEGDYANVISTVVKTGLKLKDIHADVEESFTNCKICNTKISNNKDSAEWIKNITVMQPEQIQNEAEQQNYNNWRAVNINNHDNFDDQVVENGLCYGCLVTLNTASKKNIHWYDVKNNKILDDILNEFEL
ncbi:Ncs2 protein [Hanseniaspora uvarum]|nr:Ncs2 protein [Hanseniaspora uvarum]